MTPPFKPGLVLLLLLLPLLCAQGAPPVEAIAVENSVESSHDGKTWSAIKTGHRLDYGTHVRTGEFSRVALRFPSGNVIRLSEFSNMRIARPEKDPGSAPARTQLQQGALYFFSRQRDAESDVETPAVNAAIRGTEFEIRVLADRSTELTLFDGEVLLQNAAGELALLGGERGRAAPGAAPLRIPMIDASRHIQWYLYYPAILDPAAMQLAAPNLRRSLDAYRAGDLLGALELLPAAAAGDAAIYRASLILASGQVDDAEALLRSSRVPEAAALRELIDTVRGGAGVPDRRPVGAAGWLARSYTLQAAGDLPGALDAAGRAAELAPRLGYAWSRLARLQFSSGRTAAMRGSLARARELSPMNAEAFTLSGFERAAAADSAAAQDHFLEAIRVAPAYADAWLGLGLVKFGQNDEAEALRCLLAAAALEPNRSILRSYLGKGFAEIHRDEFALVAGPSTDKALHELALARQLDPGDPTPWLYSALLKQDANRPIEAIRDLRESIRLNDNRSLFRSRLLLDEDLAVRRSNLAGIYQDAGLPTQAIAEAGKAVTADYLNFAAHDFMARSYGALLDPTGLSQRYDTVVANEMFLRNILAPAGAGLAAQGLSNQEYTSLFNQQGWSGAGTTTIDSRGRQRVSAFGSHSDGPASCAVELLHEDWGIHHFNDDFTRSGILTQFKYELTPQDRLYATVLYQESEQGDVRQITNPDATARAIRDYTVAADGRTIFSPSTTSTREVDPLFGRDPELSVRNWQDPLVFLSYGRKWSPEHTTLALVGHTSLRSEVSDALRPVTSVNTSLADPILRTYESSYRSDQQFDLQSVELQHIFKDEHNQLIVGGRFQSGEVDHRATMLAAIPDTIAGNAGMIDLIVPDAIDSAGSGRTEHDFTRWSTYAYYTRMLNDRLSLIGGLGVEGIEVADGLQSAPFTDSRTDEQLVTPKAGFVWQMDDDWVLRGAYARSLSGYSIEDQLRLEPSQVAGLVTGYRSLIPTTVTGTMAGGTNDALTLNLSGALSERTFATLEAFHGRFAGGRSFGLFEEKVFPGSFPNDPGEVTVADYRQRLDYEESSLLARLDHLVDDRLSIGASARWQRVDIDESVNAPTGGTHPLLNDSSSTLYVGSLYGRYQLPDGWFLSGALQYWQQDNDDLGADLDDAGMPIVNLTVGRLLQNQRGRIALSVLNLTGEDDGLNTLNSFIAPPDERVFTLQVDLSF